MINKKTNNTSFIDMWHTLQDLNVDNNTFMLELYDQSLLDFDIGTSFVNISSNEATKLRLSIWNECKKNIWFFFREIVKIPSMMIGGSTQITTPYLLNLDTLRLIYLFNKGYNLYVDLVPESQLTKFNLKITVILLQLYSKLVGEPDVNVINNDDNNLLKYMYESNSILPYYLLNENYDINPNIVFEYSNYRLSENITTVEQIGILDSYFEHINNKCQYILISDKDDIGNNKLNADLGNIYKYVVIDNDSLQLQSDVFGNDYNIDKKCMIKIS